MQVLPQVPGASSRDATKRGKHETKDTQTWATDPQLHPGHQGHQRQRVVGWVSGITAEVVRVPPAPRATPVWGTPPGTHTPMQGQSFLLGIAREPNVPTLAVAAAQPPKQPSLCRAPEWKQAGTPPRAGGKLRHAAMQDHM